jgi:endonuclease I
MRAPVRILSIVVALLCAILPAAARSSILISELCDPHDNYPTDRFIEIWNAGSEPVDLAGWSLVAVANNVDVLTWALSGVIGPGQALVAGNTTTVTGFTVDFPGPWSAHNGNWNGKVGDGAKLLGPSAVIVDYVVATGTAFENADYVRKPGIVAPNATYTPAEWTSTPVTLATDASPGTHETGPPPPGPVISNILTVPALPLAGAAVEVHADVVDTAAALVSVTLFWGTSVASLPNQIPMSLLSGATYRTSTPIPAEPEGTTVYYKVQATDDASATTNSDVLSYFLPYSVTIHQIQGEVAASPYDGVGVIIEGVVTARFGSVFAIQDGSGPWNGLWVRSSATVTVGDAVTVRGQITESDALGYAGTTLLANGLVTSSTPGAPLPAPADVSTGTAAAEPYEGVLVRLANATCTSTDLGFGQWQVDDGTGPSRIGCLGYAFTPTYGTSYDVIGPVVYGDASFKVEPRDAADVVWVGDHTAPVVLAIGEMSDSTFLVSFSEPVERTSAETIANYTLAGQAATAAALDAFSSSQVWLTVPGVPVGPDTLVVSGVADLYGNVIVVAKAAFTYIDTRVPPGYYDSAVGLRGTQLRAALHDIIKSHTVAGYDYAWTAFRTTDVKPNGRVWDVYSDIPGGTPPYEYTFDQTGGVGGREGTGYTREHTWCKSWFGGEVAPMYSDLWILYPCDTDVNGQRGVNPYGDVATANYTSLNGSRRGSSADPDYTGIVFEPIDAFKGDLARSYFYVSTRYYTEDTGWPGGPATDGADLLPWANQTYLTWSHQDPVSQKERLRNGAIYAIQHNRNPFVDHPEFVDLLFDSTSAVAVGDAPQAALALRPNVPNPFRQATTIRFDLPTRAPVELQILDVAGRRVRTLMSGTVLEPGHHEAVWDGRGVGGRLEPAGLYFCRLTAGPFTDTRRMVRVR